MELPKGFIPPSDTVQILLEAPGIIRQSELRRFVDLRRNENVLTKAQGEFLTVLSDDLNERFEDGWLVQMGLIQMYRDHTGIVVIEEDRSTVEVPKGFFPPSETVQRLLEAPGVIRQAELLKFVDLRDALCDEENVRTEAQGKLFAALRDDLNEHFEDGWLVEMGLILTYRGHTGTVVINDTPSLRGNSTKSHLSALLACTFYMRFLHAFSVCSFVYLVLDVISSCILCMLLSHAFLHAGCRRNRHPWGVGVEVARFVSPIVAELSPILGRDSWPVAKLSSILSGSWSGL